MAVSRVYWFLWITVCVPHIAVGLLSDYKICGDSECESLMSRVQAIRDHRGDDCRFLSFRRGDNIFVYHKLTGRRDDLWAGTIDKQFGYFPKDAVKEEQVYASTEKVVETQPSDFFCMDELGHPVDFSDPDSGQKSQGQKLQIQETQFNRSIRDTEDTDAESPPSIQVSAQQREGTASGGEETKNTAAAAAAAAAAAGSHMEEHSNPVALNEQGGSPSSSWLTSPVAGWLGLERQEESVSLAEDETNNNNDDNNDDERQETKAQTLTSSMSGWLGFGKEEKANDAVESGADAADSFTSSVTGWLGLGGETETDSAKTEQDAKSEMKDEHVVIFNSRRMSLDLEGSQLHEDEKKDVPTLDWLGNRLSHTLGFGVTNEETQPETTAETQTEQREQSASSSWLGMGNILGYGKDESSTESDFKALEQEATEIKNVDTSQTQREEETVEIPQVPRPETKAEFASIVDQKDISPQDRLEEKSQAGDETYSSTGNERILETDYDEHQAPKSIENDSGSESEEDVTASNADLDILTQSDVNPGQRLLSLSLQSDTTTVEVKEEVKERLQHKTTNNEDEEGDAVTCGVTDDGSTKEAQQNSAETHYGEAEGEREVESTESGSASHEFVLLHSDAISQESQSEKASEEEKGTISSDKSVTPMTRSKDQENVSPQAQQRVTEDGADKLSDGEKNAEIETIEEKQNGETNELKDVEKVEQQEELHEVEEMKEDEMVVIGEMEGQTEVKELNEEEEDKGKTGTMEETQEEEKQREIEETGEGETSQETLQVNKELTDEKQGVVELKDEEKREEVEQSKLEIKEHGKHEEGEDVKETLQEEVEKGEKIEEAKQEQKQQEAKILEEKENPQDMEGFKEVEETRHKEAMNEVKETRVERQQEEVMEAEEEEKGEVNKEEEIKEEEVQKEIVKENDQEEEIKELKKEEEEENKQDVRELQAETKQEGVEKAMEIEEREQVNEVKEKMLEDGVELEVEKEKQERVEESTENEKHKEEAQVINQEMKETEKQENIDELKDDSEGEFKDEETVLNNETEQGEVEVEELDKLREIKEEIKERERQELEEKEKTDMDEVKEEKTQEAVDGLQTEEKRVNGVKEEEKQEELEELKTEEKGDEEVKEQQVEEELKKDEREDEEVKEQQVEEELKTEERGDEEVKEQQVEEELKTEERGDEEVKEQQVVEELKKDEREDEEVKEQQVEEELKTEERGDEEVKEQKVEEELKKDEREDEEVKEQQVEEELKTDEREDEEVKEQQVEEELKTEERGGEEVKEQQVEEELKTEERGGEEVKAQQVEEELKTEERGREEVKEEQVEEELKTEERGGEEVKAQQVEEELKTEERGGEEVKEQQAEEELKTEERGGEEVKEQQVEEELKTEERGGEEVKEQQVEEELKTEERGGEEVKEQQVEEELKTEERGGEEVKEQQAEEELKTEERGDEEVKASAFQHQEILHENKQHGQLHPSEAQESDLSDDNVLYTESEDSETIRHENKPEQLHSSHNTDVNLDSQVNQAVISEHTVPLVSKDPTGSSLSDDGNTRAAETEGGGAFGLFKNVFGFYSQTPSDSVDSGLGLEETSQPQQASLISEREMDSSADLDQDSPVIMSTEELQQSSSSADVQTSTLSHSRSPSQHTEQTKALPNAYKFLLAYMSVDEASTLVELFGPYKLPFLDFMLGSSEIVTEDESILSDIERHLQYHRETLSTPATRLEDKEKTRTLAALQKLEMLITRVRETSSTRNSDTRGNDQADVSCVSGSCSTHSKDGEMSTEQHTVKTGDPSVAQNNNIPTDERTVEENDGQRRRRERENAKSDKRQESDGGCEEESVSLAGRPHDQSGSLQPLEGALRGILDTVHHIAEESVAHVRTVKELLIWTAQVVSSLPDDIRPGPDLYGVPWEPVIISCVVGLVTVLLFTCRCYSSIKSRMYRSKERWMAAQVAQLLDEKCKVLESLSKCQQEYDEVEESLRDSGVLAQTQKTEHLEVRKAYAIIEDQMKARELDRSKIELERDLEQLKVQLDQQKQHRIEQERRVLVLEGSMKTHEEEIKDLHSQEEQGQTTLKVYSMNSDRLHKSLDTAGEENRLLQESNAQLRQQVEGWAERVSEVEEEMRRCEVTYSGMQQDVARKDERIMSLTDCLLRMKALDSDLEEEGSEEGAATQTSPGKEGENGRGNVTDTQSHFQKAQTLIYAAKLNADLKSVDEDKDRVFAKLNDEIKAKEDLQVSIKELEDEKLSLQSDSGNYSDQVQRLQQKLNIMTEMYQENELKLHRLLTVEEKERLQKEEKLCKADKNIALAMEELNNYRQRAGEMEEELDKTKQSYQTQISAHEKKAHNNWLAARAAERELSDIRRENALLRQKLTDTQFKLDTLDKDPYALDTLARPMPFRGERSPYGPSPLGRPASETRPFLSPPTLMDGPPVRLSPRVGRGPTEPPGGQGEMERSGGPHSDSGSNSPSWERDRRGPPPGPPGPGPGLLGPPGYIFSEPGAPVYRRPPPGSLPPGPPPPHLRAFPAAVIPPGAPHPADMADGSYRENSFGPGEQDQSGSGERRTPPDADLRMGPLPPPGPPLGPMDGPFPGRPPYGPPPPDFYPSRGPGVPPMMPRWAPPPPGMMLPPRFPPGGLPPAPHPHYAGPMRSFAPPSMAPLPPLPPQQSLPSPPQSQTPEEHRPSPEDAI